jgi:hypothetical protein
MIYGIKILFDIELQKPCICFALPERIADSGMCAFALSASVCMMYQRALKERLQNIHYGVVHNTLFERGGAYNAGLGVVNLERAIVPPSTVKRLHFFTQSIKAGINIPTEFESGGTSPVAAKGFEKCEADIAAINNFVKKVVLSFQ